MAMAKNTKLICDCSMLNSMQVPTVKILSLFSRTTFIIRVLQVQRFRLQREIFCLKRTLLVRITIFLLISTSLLKIRTATSNKQIGL